ncbi:hypothetical protein EDF68_103314 [Ochrobactrum sp. BH3]|nr:hypothetical protein EDF68_103314 [Ochrobactrum sp. BH3]
MFLTGRTYAIAAFFVIAPTVAGAAACTSYERQVYDVARKVNEFRQTKQFIKEYGWSAAGPYQPWLKEIQALNADKENATKLLVSHGFTPMEIYSVADEFRTAGRLDAFYTELDTNIKSLKCR